MNRPPISPDERRPELTSDDICLIRYALMTYIDELQSHIDWWNFCADAQFIVRGPTAYGYRRQLDSATALLDYLGGLPATTGGPRQ